ncbi:MAG: SH3 domain-containing protein [Phyllobacteriaceae bacterium]|nr:SH3 domain-containing protein [Phyllobacteriaceae bacterium]
MRQAKIHWGGQPPRANRARAAIATESWAPPPTALYTGIAGLGLAAGAMLIAAGLARQPDLGALHAASMPAAETLPAPAERPDEILDEPAAIAAATETDDRIAEAATAAITTPAAPTVDAPVAARFGGTAGSSETAPPFAMAASDAERSDPTLAAFADDDAPVPAPLSAEAEPVEVAATEAEVLAIEERLAAQGDPNFVLPPETGTDAASASAAGPGGAPQPVTETAAQSVQPADLPPAWASEHVNLRAGPDNDATVLAIIPGNAAFAAEAGCEHWCAAVYEGQSGYVYGSFIRRDAP